ncbi:haloalkane dehalogenase [Nocardioides perillae]|uniref:Haloalkane dehalogenase n=1 Tax=Nocardioides perillae TaxID=1119534 RepID=A0A7Y9RVK4_9ACTN|nr:haloalkane dehalogenase [Nocardioides perillae]NYG54740.1 haloalkane dehalogenase [Nocardioides perillae]
MESLRTPDDRFRDLPDFSYDPTYVEVDDTEGGRLRVAVVDEGPADAPVALLMHGEPTWSFLYRRMVPVLLEGGMRVVAPDLVGFGRSDKPTERTDYTYARHVGWMREALFDHLDLREATLVCQDWGGLVGLRLVAEHPDRFARVVAANTGLPTGDQRMSEAFEQWRTFSQTVEDFSVSAIVAMGCATPPAPAVQAAYDAPFPDDTYKAGARVFPTLVPASPDDPAAADQRRAWESLARFDKPFHTAFSDGDPITRGGEAPFRTLVPGAQGVAHTTVAGGGHFLQEDVGPELARFVLEVAGLAGPSRG